MRMWKVIVLWLLFTAVAVGASLFGEPRPSKKDWKFSYTFEHSGNTISVNRRPLFYFEGAEPSVIVGEYKPDPYFTIRYYLGSDVERRKNQIEKVIKDPEEKAEALKRVNNLSDPAIFREPVDCRNVFQDMIENLVEYETIPDSVKITERIPDGKGGLRTDIRLEEIDAYQKLTNDGYKAARARQLMNILVRKTKHSATQSVECAIDQVGPKAGPKYPALCGVLTAYVASPNNQREIIDEEKGTRAPDPIGYGRLFETSSGKYQRVIAFPDGICNEHLETTDRESRMEPGSCRLRFLVKGCGLHDVQRDLDQRLAQWSEEVYDNFEQGNPSEEVEGAPNWRGMPYTPKKIPGSSRGVGI
ncbi:MAG: hypothetical protein AB1540_13270 [Bdellovibrionota bacterium]